MYLYWIMSDCCTFVHAALLMQCNKASFLGLAKCNMYLKTHNLLNPKVECLFYRSLSLSRAYHVERGSSLARFHWSAVTAGWSRTPNVASAALCHASLTWLAHRSKSGRCVRTFFITDFSSDVQAQTHVISTITVLAVYPISCAFPGCTCRLRPRHIAHDSSSCGPLYQWDRTKGHAWGEWCFPALIIC